jgi:YidC/Oxa1 family membrane protein insertase
MDNKRLILAMGVFLAFVLGWQAFINWLYVKNNWERPGMSQVEPATRPAGDVPGATPAPGQDVEAARGAPQAAPGAPSGGASALSSPAGLRPLVASGESNSATLGSEKESDPNFALFLRLNAIGAGLDAVTLNGYRRAVGSKDLYTFQEPLAGTEQRAMATTSVVVNGTEIKLDGVPWKLEGVSKGQADGLETASAAFSLDLGDDSGPKLRLTKTWHVFSRGPSNGPGGYEVLLQQGMQNLSGEPLTVRLRHNGPLTPPREMDRGGGRHVLGGYLQESRVIVNHELSESYTASRPVNDLTKGPDGQPLLWAGTCSVYFNALVAPELEKSGNSVTQPIASVKGVLLNPQDVSLDHVILTQFESADFKIEPGQTARMDERVFLGPRTRALLNNAYYQAPLKRYDQSLVLTSGPCAVCTFQWLVDVLVVMLGWFHAITRDWGIAIILLVVLVRALLHPITKKSQLSMMKLGKMGPEIERIKKKYGDNKDELNKAMMELYKEQGFTPVLGCLPMFLQMPIWIALWQALYTTFELRHASFLWGFTWIKDLARPDHLIEFSRSFNLFGLIPVSGLNVLPIIMGIVFYIQMKTQPKPPSMSPEQEQQQKIMTWMMVGLFPLMLYGGPSGLNLYILTSTLLGIVESKIIRNHMKKREELEAAGKVIVDAGKVAPGRSRGAKAPPPPKTGLGGWLANLQAKAEAVRREAEKRKKA